MSELKKELEQDKSFIEEVANRIYLDTDDIEESMPEPEWIDRMTDIADKYITRFETSYNFANNLADELLASNVHLNDNQKIVLEQLKINAGSNGSLTKAIHSLYNLLTISSSKLEKDGAEGLLKTKNALARLTRKQAAEVLAAFAQWGLEQEEAE